jgi:hypothetical protein
VSEAAPIWEPPRPHNAARKLYRACHVQIHNQQPRAIYATGAVSRNPVTFGMSCTVLVEQSFAQDATFPLGGHKVEGAGIFYQATTLGDVAPG